MADPGLARDAFPTTRWTLVVAAGDKENIERGEALESLCGSYWYPVYAFIRRRGYPPEQAQDLTQEFFVRVLSGTFFERANPDKGRFRSFLLGAVKNFLADANDREKSKKRGGGVRMLTFDFKTGESNYSREPKHEETPERIFQRRWARALLDRVVANLRDEHESKGNLVQFNRLKGYLAGDGDSKYAELARELQLTESGIKSAIRRLRQRYRDLLRAEVASTVADSAEVDEELRFLLQSMSAQPQHAK
jgi:RNA polymerase sigma factor (sigma-70 family)